MDFRDYLREKSQEFEKKKDAWEASVDRIYLDAWTVSDRVNPEAAEVYVQAADGVEDVEVRIDSTGELSGRDAPAEGYSFAVIIENRTSTNSDSGIFWDRLNDGLDALETAQQVGNLEQA